MVIPYTKRCYDRYGAGLRFGRGLHMCGPSTHLLDILADDLRISDFNVFGCPGTPIENLLAFTEAAEEYGQPASHNEMKQ